MLPFPWLAPGLDHDPLHSLYRRKHFPLLRISSIFKLNSSLLYETNTLQSSCSEAHHTSVSPCSQLFLQIPSRIAIFKWYFPDFSIIPCVLNSPRYALHLRAADTLYSASSGKERSHLSLSLHIALFCHTFKRALVCVLLGLPQHGGSWLINRNTGQLCGLMKVPWLIKEQKSGLDISARPSCASAVCRRIRCLPAWFLPF